MTAPDTAVMRLKNDKRLRDRLFVPGTIQFIRGKPAHFWRRDYICEVCRQTFSARANWDCPRRFCSQHCYGLAQRKRTISNCLFCGKPFEALPFEGQQYCSVICSNQSRRKDWRYAHFTDYGPEWPTIRSKVFGRDGYQCTNCGKKGYIVVHHKQGIETYLGHEFANDEGNLITLCESCHRRVHNGNLTLKT